MIPYSTWYGDLSDCWGEYTWQPLPNGNHRALGDCRALLEGLKEMAEFGRPDPGARQFVLFLQTPRLHEEAALALGATRWEMVRYAVFPYARSGMVSGGDARPRPRARRDDGRRDGAGDDAADHAQRDRHRQPADDRGEHRPELQGGDARAAVAADRDRPGALRGHLPGQLRRPLDRRPQRAEDGTDEPAAADAAISQPAAAALGAGPGRRRWRWPLAGLPALLAGLEPRRPGWSLASCVFLVAMPAVVAPGRGPARGRRPARDRADLDGVRDRGGAAGLAAVGGAQQRAARDQRRLPHLLDAAT